MGGHTPSVKSLILGKVLFLYELKTRFHVSDTADWSSTQFEKQRMKVYWKWLI